MKRIVDSLDLGVANILLIVMTTLTFINVVSRYFIHMSISFTDELTSSLFVLFSLLGASVAVKNRSHLGLTLLTELLPRGLQKLIACFGCLLGALFCAIVAHGGVKMVLHQYAIGQTSPGLKMPECIYGSFIPIGMAIMCVRFLECAYKTVRRDSAGASEKSEEAA